MAERSLRGARLGTQSFEDERGVEMAPRQEVVYTCTRHPEEHKFTLTMADDAEVPMKWECPRCGAVAKHAAGIESTAKEAKPARTHWDMLLERRSIPELEEILTERLELLRAGKIGPVHVHRRNSKRKRTA